jgi:hypothetical protein
MRRKREPVVESVAINSAYRAGAIIGTPDTVVVAQGAEGEIKIAQSFPQQGIGDIKGMLVETWRPRASVVTTVASPAPLIQGTLVSV